jgi:hypothetical protein
MKERRFISRPIQADIQLVEEIVMIVPAVNDK